ncbi:hypothetical protein BE08_38260 [Sorangium cellulosum]|uniref:Uncharacterized protein n=1 Tax=Sorangium cellulosum TaxID=56 RepID=A0A150PF04_SORCE|nr:hypothetical protein BE08_38260 [Sorangium cellulosum]
MSAVAATTTSGHVAFASRAAAWSRSTPDGARKAVRRSESGDMSDGPPPRLTGSGRSAKRRSQKARSRSRSGEAR